MSNYEIAMLIGFPSICVAILGYVARKILKALKKRGNDEKYVKEGVQALLRSQMIKDYNHYSQKGYAPIYAKENFENCYKAYHNLGFNGVMDGTRDKFLALPTGPDEGEQ